MHRAYLVVEGHGDGQAALNFVHRLARDRDLAGLHWTAPIRGRNLHQERGIQKAGELVRRKGDASAIQMLRESDPPLPCFGSLERAVCFLQSQVHSGAAAVYPPSTA